MLGLCVLCLTMVWESLDLQGWPLESLSLSCASSAGCTQKGNVPFLAILVRLGTQGPLYMVQRPGV